MFDAIHDVTSRGIIDYAARPRHEWVLHWPGMVVLVVTAVYWTRGEAPVSPELPSWVLSKPCLCRLALQRQLQA
jgi:hypothetical protein